uniref:BMA-KLP-12, isoform a n=1 Tax=Brugia malayi TaxID=6279 RepID=A0A0J9Y348_BRUMA|nr:BMA-KLP-12, isoform a [Brugia malayi]
MDDSSCVRVAVRVRPQSEREKVENSHVCTNVLQKEAQITIGGERSFTFDYAFDIGTHQQKIYDDCVKNLIEGTFEGFNATVLAYGQTGSGKTYTMGTAFDMMDVMNEIDVGIVPRAIRHLFSGMDSRKQQALEQGFVEPCFDIVAQFVELYNEDIIDLLSHERSPTGLRIHEDAKGEIFLNGVTRVTVTSPSQTLEVLKNGALNRKTASTNMNEQSSRSHAIFTVIIKQQRTVVVKPCFDPQTVEQGDETSASEDPPATELELLSAKFHFVDLAGSERLKRTGATGDRIKEGININFGLLALGNVICALTTPTAVDKMVHIPYRDSKLTRLLQDSLGGNSRTLMIACISPSDCDYVETLNTLKYANRAKDIKNKVIANQDKSSKLIGTLRSRIAELEAELLDFKQGRIIVSDGIESFNDQYRENVLLQADVSQLRIRIKALQETVEMLRARNVQLLAEKNEGCTRMRISDSHDQQVCIESTTNEVGEQEGDAFGNAVRVYIDELESLRCALMESHATNEQLHQQMNRWKAIAANNTPKMHVDYLVNCAAVISNSSGNNAERVTASTPTFSLIQEAKADIKRMKQSIIESSLEEEKINNDEAKINADDVMKSSVVMDDFEVDYEDDEDIEVENEAETECFKLRDNLADLQAEISIKERLVIELEQSERRLAEKKLAELSLRINEMEIERDRVLAEIAAKHSQKVVDAEQVRKIREDYERKLTAMRDEFRKLQSVEREHRRMQAKQVAEQQQLLRLRNELNELKKTKVQLMQRIKEEARRAKATELANMKKLAGLEKESRKKDNLIQKLQNKDRQREDFLKRSTDEVNRLRQQVRQRSTYDRKTERSGTQRNMRSASLRQGCGTVPLTKLEVNKAKAKWMAIVKNIRRRISQRQAVTKMEDELEKIVAEKRILAEEIQRLEQQFIKAKDLAERDLIGEHIDGCYAKMRYVQEQFTELRNTIAGIDTEKDSGMEDAEACRDAETEIKNCSSIGEAVIILSHLFGFCLEQGFIAAKAISDKKEAESLIQELQNESILSDVILNHALEDAKRNTEQQNRSRDASPYRECEEVRSLANGNQIAQDSRDELLEVSPPASAHKIRRRTATPSELLYPLKESLQGQVTNKTHLEQLNEETSSVSQQLVEKARSLEHSVEGGRPLELNSVSSNVGMEAKNEITKLMDLELDDRGSTESSPSGRGSRRKSGRVVPYVPRTLTGTRDKVTGSRLLIRTHTLDGHTRTVLSVDTNGDMVISGSKDRTAKVWDLEKSVEKCTFGHHPNNVSCVRFIPSSQLALTLSMAFVRIWDLRNEECVRTLHSSGLAAAGDTMAANTPRQTVLPISETMINALELDNTGKLMFTTFNSDVRIWNLEKFAPFGRLSAATHGSRSEVSCLGFLGGIKPKIFTGSRDHYIKMYEINADGLGLFEASHEFSAAHYDCVTSIVAYGDSVFSASRDTDIMRFSLQDMKRDHIELQAHNKWIQSMCIINAYRPLLVTACKEGRVKVWDITSTRKLRLVDQISHAHEEAINELATHSGILFTASSDTTVALWQTNYE